MPNCEFCNNNFSTNVSLYNHQRKTKYCIEIQKSNNIQTHEIIYTCEWCKKTFLAKHHLNRHLDSCKIKSDTDNESAVIKNKELLEEIEGLREIIKNQNIKIFDQNHKITNQNLKIVELTVRLEKETEIKDTFESLHSKKDNCIEKIAMQPKTIQTSQTSNQNTQNTHNQNILNNLPIFNITKEQLQKAAETDFSLELFLQGQVGVAKFTIGVFRKAHDDKLPWIVSDQARDIFKTKDEDGNIIVDPRAERLTAMVMEAVKEKNKQHHDSFYPKRNCNSDDERDEEEIDREGKIELDDQIRADNCYMDIMKMNRDNKVFRKRLIKESRQSSS